MDGPLSVTSMIEQDRQISEIVAGERSRLRNFFRRRVPDPSDAEDIVQEVFYELVEANRLLMPIEHVTGWAGGRASTGIAAHPGHGGTATWVATAKQARPLVIQSRSFSFACIHQGH